MHLLKQFYSLQVIAMEDGRIRAQGQLNDIELKDRELIENWRELMSTADSSALQGRTARERWQLIKLVARIGRELKQRNSSDGSWSTEEDSRVGVRSTVPTVVFAINLNHNQKYPRLKSELLYKIR